MTLGRPIALSGVLLAALVGCSPEARVGDDRGDRPDAGADQGSPDGGGLPGDGGLDRDAGPPRDLMCVDTGLPPLDVDYDGTMDELDLPSGSDRVRLRLRETAPGSFAGIMVFGARAPTPPDVEDPDRCDFVYCANGITSSDDPRIDLGGSPRFFEGFQYPLSDIVVDESLVEFSVEGSAPLEVWCTAQRPVDQLSGSRWSCLPNRGGGQSANGCFINPPAGGDAEVEPVECCRLDLCLLSRRCECDADGCWAAPSRERFTLLVRPDGSLFRDGLRLSPVETSDR